MLQRENKQKDFFDDYVYKKLLLQKHILLDIKSKIDFSFVEEAVKGLYSDNMGRPSFPPVVLFKMLFLEFFYNLSDYGIVEERTL
ncbi:MAG: transposase [Candidatus Omnitrophica bacterium]|nr:transposase [Candidatus Omnitrophota bacterium]MBU4590547.1 transposase [Candidatus Omnitrophota bacterium]